MTKNMFPVNKHAKHILVSKWVIFFFTQESVTKCFTEVLKQRKHKRLLKDPTINECKEKLVEQPTVTGDSCTFSPS